MKIKYGISPIAWLNDDMPKLTSNISVEQCLKDIKLLGFKGVEYCNSFPKNPLILKRLFKKYQLKLPGSWFSGSILNKSVKEEYSRVKDVVKRIKIMKTNNLIYCDCTNSIQSGGIGLKSRPKLNKNEKIKFFQKLNLLSKKIYEFDGINICYHHHMGTIIQNKNEIDQMMSSTNDELKLLIDTGHLIFAGAKPHEIYKTFHDRVTHIHLKDIRMDTLKISLEKNYSFKKSFVSGVFTVPGDGNYKFKDFLDLLKKKNYNGWLIIEAEQDPKKYPPFFYSNKGFEYLKKNIK
tara:strand:+ start:384 stop:1259 length:876 start_codon:yes stop_codon:yes gene_type:complete